MDTDTIREVEVAAAFCEDKPEFSGLSTSALRPLIRERDEEVRDEAIRHVEKVSLVKGTFRTSRTLLKGASPNVLCTNMDIYF